MVDRRTTSCFLSMSIVQQLFSTSEKATAPLSSTLAWNIPWMEEPGRLQSMGSLRVGHDWATSLSLFTFMHWRRKWQPTPVFLPGESQGWGSLVGCCLWGHTESDTEATQQQQQQQQQQLQPMEIPGHSDGKESTYNARDLGSIPESERSPGEGNDYPFQYSCLENPMDGGAW